MKKGLTNKLRFEDHGLGSFRDAVDHREVGPDEHREELGRELQGRSSDKPGGLLADPDEDVGEAVEDEDVLGVEVFLLQPVLRDFDLW